MGRGADRKRVAAEARSARVAAHDPEVYAEVSAGDGYTSGRPAVGDFSKESRSGDHRLRFLRRGDNHFSNPLRVRGNRACLTSTDSPQCDGPSHRRVDSSIAARCHPIRPRVSFHHPRPRRDLFRRIGRFANPTRPQGDHHADTQPAGELALRKTDRDSAAGVSGLDYSVERGPPEQSPGIVDGPLQPRQTTFLAGTWHSRPKVGRRASQTLRTPPSGRSSSRGHTDLRRTTSRIQLAEACGVTLPRNDAGEKDSVAGRVAFGAATGPVDPLVRSTQPYLPGLRAEGKWQGRQRSPRIS